MINIEEIKSFFKGKILIQEPLSKHTTFKIGGVADFYFEPQNKKDLIELVDYFKKVKFPFIIIGNGSNLLVSDDGLRSAVISLENSLNSKKFIDGYIIAEAGLKLSTLVDFSIHNGKIGLEMLAGIPGSLGGALIMNASAYGGSISDYLYDVEVYKNSEVKIYKKDEIDFSYRRSSLLDSVILEASFKLSDGDIEKLSESKKTLLEQRKVNQPVNYPSAGCIFRNPINHHAGVLIQEAGLKGMKIGGAEVSNLHGNFIINTDNAKAKDVIELINLIKDRIKIKNNIDLDVEIKLVGFEDNPFKNNE
jgi:UDP-N-acetylmuramate dehydrogenase